MAAKKLKQKQVTGPSIGEPIHLPKLSHLVAERLRSQIVSGELSNGDRLPSESELLAIYNVSRPTLREALRILEAEELIIVARGNRSGAAVLGPTIDRAAQYASNVLVAGGTTLADIHEARMFIEPPVVRALALRPNRSKIIRELTQYVRAAEVAQKAGRFDEALEAINGFHAQLIRSSGNQTLGLVIGLVHAFAQQAHATALLPGHSAEAIDRNMDKTMSSLRTVLEHISAGEADLAETFWRRHMERAYEFLMRTGIGSRRLMRMPVKN